MKIMIIGPSGGGKTTFSKDIAKEYNVEATPLDYVFYDHVGDKKRVRVPEEIWSKRVDKVTEEQSWVIEGIQFVPNVAEHADYIVYVKPPLAVAIFRQWKRFFTDPVQRREHGFRKNLTLSKAIFFQYLEQENLELANDPRYFSISKIERLLNKYEEKVITVGSNIDLEKILEIFIATNESKTKDR